MNNMLLPFFFILILSSSSTLFAPTAVASPTSNLPPSLSLTQPTNLTATPSLSNSLHCVDVLNPFVRRPKYLDCIDAIDKLPAYDLPGAFHNYGDRDPFLLPRQETVRSCEVRVELNAATSTEAGSWVEINKRAGTLNRLCFQDTFPLYRGAWGKLGKHERIVVSLAYPGKSGDEGVDSER